MFTQGFVTRGLKIKSSAKLFKALYSKPSSVHPCEIEIPVPWGKIAGKLWGLKDKQPILAMHGWQDNAASFDSIAPLIKNESILAIDLPGHGLSSWLPPGFMYSELVYFLLVKRIKKYYGWEKIKVMAHSVSAATMYWYAATFPNEMQYVVALDLLKFPDITASTYIPMFRNAVDAFFKIEESNMQPSYTQSEIMKKGESRNIDKLSNEILMARGTRQKEDGIYVFTRDPRIRVIPIHSMFSQVHLEECAKLITCPYLIIKGDTKFYAEDKENFYAVLEAMKATNDKIYFESFSATHHPHLTHAEETAAIINPFIKKYS
ncbi:hypothetical protein P5V15_001859 [Pogonomyrmex californicus]